jgi:hypothetical protein
MHTSAPAVERIPLQYVWQKKVPLQAARRGDSGVQVIEETSRLFQGLFFFLLLGTSAALVGSGFSRIGVVAEDCGFVAVRHGLHLSPCIVLMRVLEKPQPAVPEVVCCHHLLQNSTEFTAWLYVQDILIANSLTAMKDASWQHLCGFVFLVFLEQRNMQN